MAIIAKGVHIPGGGGGPHSQHVLPGSNKKKDEGKGSFLRVKASSVRTHKKGCFFSLYKRQWSG